LDDYSKKQFGFTQEMNVFYGTALRFNGGVDSLRMNIFKPLGDDNSKRPIVVLVHGGGFYEGHRNNFNELASWYAQRGYVAATISYRLGFYTLGYPYTFDQHEIIRAIYRGMQDTRGAIRYLKGRAISDSSDIERVVLAGGSAGAFIVLAAAYLDKASEKPISCQSISPVVLEQRPDLGSIEGTMNLNGHDTKVKAVVNIFGAMVDTNWVESATDPALYSYHQSADPVVGCHFQKPYWGMGLGIADNYPTVYGSCIMAKRYENLNYDSARIETYIHQGTQHDIHNVQLTDSLIAEFLNEQICNRNTGIPEADMILNASVYPNPVKSELKISSNVELQGAKFVLIDCYGKTVLKGKVNDKSINTEKVEAGIYFLSIESLANQVFKIVKD
jgi:predicted esterase